VRIAIYARVSTQDQQTLPIQIEAMRKYAESLNWTIVQEVQDIRSGVSERKNRELLLKLARRKEIDAIVVWRLDRWGRSLADLILSLKELSEVEVGFVSLTEAIDLTTPTGRALAGMLSVFAEFEREILRQRVKAGIAQARKNGGNHGRPRTAAQHTYKVKKMAEQSLSKAEIARRLDISRASVMRILTQQRKLCNYTVMPKSTE